jgi:Protein of unknown function (DUF1203)
MTVFKVIALPTEVADFVRLRMLAPKYGHPAFRSLANGYGPCRHCLRTFREGQEDRILFTYDPFDQILALPLPGPVFIHADRCDRYREDAGFPEDVRSHRLTVGAYAAGRKLVSEVYVENGNVEPVIEQLFANSSIKYLHVSDTGAGCYDFRIERDGLGGGGKGTAKAFKC